METEARSRDTAVKSVSADGGTKPRGVSGMHTDLMSAAG